MAPLTTSLLMYERKTAYKNAWYELKIYFKNYELLITGAVCGRFDNDQHECFLGSSRAPVTLMQQTHWLIIAPQTAVPCERDARLLQSFRNTASTNNWTFKSQNFVKKGISHRASSYFSRKHKQSCRLFQLGVIHSVLWFKRCH